RLFVVNAETGQTEVQKFHERPAAISGLTAHDHDIARFDRAVTQSEISRRAKRPDDLQTNPQNCVRAHRAMTHDPRLGRFAVHPFRNKTEIFVVGLESDDEYLGLVSEWVDGETAESWIVSHGPMSADAVLRIGLQVVRALGAAAYLALSHRAIEPGDIMIVRGQTADGGWPFVKLLNFGLAGLGIYDEQPESKELAPAAAPQFASPEQLLDKPIDFRSEIYSLGASI